MMHLPRYWLVCCLLLVSFILSILLGCAGGTSISSSDISSSETPTPQVPTDYAHTPVLFVHGSGLNSGTWKPMMQDFIRAGYPSAYLKAIDLVPDNGSNVRAAKQFIAPAVDALLAEAATAAKQAGVTGAVAQRVDLVSHSMGAVSTRWYIAKIAPERVRTWVAIAGANHGTDAICLLSGAGNQEICPAFATNAEKNPVQIALNGTPSAPIDETPYGLGRDRATVKSIPPDNTRQILYLTVRIDPDRWIKPENSAVIDGAGGLPITIPPDVPVQETSPGNYLFQERVGHDPLPEHPQLIQLVRAMLSVDHQSEVSK